MNIIYLHLIKLQGVRERFTLITHTYYNLLSHEVFQNYNVILTGTSEILLVEYSEFNAIVS